jgi:hypothetical protein
MYADPAADADFLKGEWGFLNAASDLTKGNLNPFGAEEWPRHIAVLVGAVDWTNPPYQDDNSKRRDAILYGKIVRLAVYNQIIGFKNAPQLRSHLLRSKTQDEAPVHEILGFDSIPHQNTIRDAFNDRMGRAIQEFVKNAARRIETVGIKRGYEFPEVDEDRLTNNGGVTEIPVELKRGYTHGALDLLRDDMPIEKAGNPMYDDYGVHFDFSLHLCQTGGTPEGELENFADNRGLQTYTDIWGDAETFRNDVYRVPIGAWRATFNNWTNRLLDAVYGDELRARDLPVAVDATNIPTWTNEESDLAGVIGTEKMDNTHFAYRILNAQVVSDGLPFQIGHELQMDSADREDRLEDLIDRVRERDFNIGLLLVDSEFASGKVVNRLKSMDVDFVIAYPKRHVTKYTDQWEDERTTLGIEENYVIRKDATPPTRAETTLFGEYQSKLGGYTDESQKRLSDFFNPEAEWLTGRQNQQTLAAYEEHFEEDIFEANNRMRWFTFVTNLNVGEEEARALREYYHYRWAIESAFSDYKQNFLPTTKSTNLGMRVYLYMFGMTAYNAWVAANTKARRQHLEDSERNRPPIRASRFTTLGQQRYRGEFHRDYISFRE